MTHSQQPMVLPILQEGSLTLEQPSLSVTEFDATLQLLVDSMTQTLNHYKGRGLAAVQVGVLKRVLIARADGQHYTMINPVITRKLQREIVEFEGCLSVDRMKWRKVSRPAKCDVEYQDVTGAKILVQLSGEPARVIQHEMDHLDGILITSKPLI